MTGFELQTYWDRSDCYINSATITSVVAAKTVKEKALEQSAKINFVGKQPSFFLRWCT